MKRFSLTVAERLEHHLARHRFASSATVPRSTPSAPLRLRKNLPAAARQTMRAWLKAHVDNPYPTDEEKVQLAAAGGITVEQVTTWFINARSRELKKLRHLRSAPGGPPPSS